MLTFLADLIAALHLAYVSYVVVGQLLIVLGCILGWRWVRNPWFRWSHLAMILIVAVESVFNWTCPLTTWERELRLGGGQKWIYDFPLDSLTSAMGSLSEPTGIFYAVQVFQSNEVEFRRGRIGQPSFIQNLVSDLMFFDNVPDRFFTVGYLTFAALVALTFWVAPPKRNFISTQVSGG